MMTTSFSSRRDAGCPQAVALDDFAHPETSELQPAQRRFQVTLLLLLLSLACLWSTVISASVARGILAEVGKRKRDRLYQYRNYLQLLEESNWSELVGELMVNYYDPLYQHTLPERRVEVDLEPEETVIERIQAAVTEVLGQSSPN